MSGVLPDYSRQAEGYDETRSASPSVLRVLRHALAGTPGRRLADIGGGTGNYPFADQRFDAALMISMLHHVEVRSLALASAGGDPERASRAALIDFTFEDMQDASLAAMSADPERVLEAGGRGETSFFERTHGDHPDELQAGLARLREDIAAGRAPRHAGAATVVSWTKR